MDFFKNASKTFGDVIGPVDVPSYGMWFVTPLVVTLVIMAYVGYLIFRNWDTVTICNPVNVDEEEAITDDKDVDQDGCREVEFKSVWRFLIVAMVASIVASIVAASVYRMAVYVKNPKIGMGIEATRYLTDILNNK